MQLLEVSGVVRHIYVIRQLKVNMCIYWTKEDLKTTNS